MQTAVSSNKRLEKVYSLLEGFESEFFLLRGGFSRFGDRFVSHDEMVTRSERVASYLTYLSYLVMLSCFMLCISPDEVRQRTL